MFGLGAVGARVAALVLAACLLMVPGSAVAQTSDSPTVDMKGLAFNPTVIHITPGQSVTWTNSDPVQHTVTSDDGLFDSGLVDPGSTFVQEFDTPGTYQYFCQPHGSAGLHGMAATVIVDDPSTSSDSGG